MYRRLFSPRYISHFEESPFADWLKDFDAWLQASDYCLPKRRQHIAHVRHVLERSEELPDDRRFDATDLDRMFNCRVRPRSFRHSRWAFEQYLRARGLWITVPVSGPHQPLIDTYTTYLRELQGLAPATVDQKLRVVHAFLTLCCAPPRTTQELAPRDVERFIARRARQLGRSAIIQTVAYLRLFLRFCRERGLCPAGLDEIDRPTKYRDERPPRAIPWALSQRLLASIDRSTRMGCRDHAMLYLMAHFGLRTGEVGGLDLADLDLRSRVLRVRQDKVHATLCLPLPRQAISVLKRYLRYGRPRTQRCELFLSVAAPLTRMTRGALSEAFRRHVERSGLPLTGHSPYGLRHGFAMRLLERGVGLKAIGDLLGHNTFESTAVYLRLNTEALREVALSVPRSTERRVS
jgi:integrase/recombinase XerD